MQRVSAAFRYKDLSALRAVSHEAEIEDPTFEARSIGEKLVWAIREVARLDDVIAALEEEFAFVKANDTHDLWRRQESGEHVIETLEAALSAELTGERERLAELIATYRQLIERQSV
jgi:hypothetical protein